MLEDDKEVSIIILFALASISSSFVFKASVKSLVDSPLPLILSTLLFKAVFITLFCTGFELLLDNVLSTVILLAPFSMFSNLVFKALVKSFEESVLPLTLSTLLVFNSFISSINCIISELSNPPIAIGLEKSLFKNNKIPLSPKSNDP